MSYEIVNHPLKGRTVIATRCFSKGDLVNVGKAVNIAPKRDSHSLQMREHFHVYFDEPACLFSHSCDWNLYIVDNDYGGYNFHASRDIEEGEELSFYYGMSEAESVAVPECKCGSDTCYGRSYGFKEAPKELQEALYRDGIAAYLKTWYERQNPSHFYNGAVALPVMQPDIYLP